MLSFLSFALAVGVKIPLLEATAECDLFHYGELCTLYPASNIVDMHPDLENEVECQNRCALNSLCNYFMFQLFRSGHNACFLLQECMINTISCVDTPDCQMAILGPKTPSLTDACCRDFEDETCEMESEIGHFYDVAGASECQRLCRDTTECRYWSLHGDICLLYSECGNPQPCSSCTSGPAFPEITTCQQEQNFFHTLVLGGETDDADYSTSVELVTPDLVCSPKMDPLPVGREQPQAAMLGSKVFYCGGFEYQDISKSCHSYDLDAEDEGWREEASMVFPRRSFSLTAVGDMIFAIGGEGSSYSPHSSVEVFSQEAGWRQDPKLTMGAAKQDHCSADMGSWLYTTGGILEEMSEKYVSNLVEAYDTSSTSATTWVRMASMIEQRYGHGCHSGVFSGEEGIFVAGGSGDSGDYLDTAEFYFALSNRWQMIGALNTARKYSPMTMVGDNVVLSGGRNPSFLTSVETWNGSSWDELNNLKVGRKAHAAVSIEAGKLKCEM